MAIFNEFPYTNFHEMNMDWILAKMKELAAEWLTYQGNMNAWKEDTEAAFDELKTYVRDYFDNLNVSNEISAKIDEMLTDGSFAAAVAPDVSSWLAEHITPTSPAVDSSFTVSGAAADSKTVGDKTHWYRGRIGTGLLSDRNTNGWWVLDADSVPTDAPEPFTTRAFLHVYNGSSHAAQFLQYITGHLYYRDIKLSEPTSIGDWREITQNVFEYNGRITEGLLSNNTLNGWYYITTGTTLDDMPFNTVNYTFLMNYRTPAGVKQVITDVYDRITYTRWISGSSIGPWRNTSFPLNTWDTNNAEFVREMNRWATRLDLTNLVWANPSGTNPNNMTSARDLCKLASFAANIGVLSDISSRENAVIFNGTEEVTVTNSTPRSYFDDKYDIIFTKTGQLTGDNAINNLVTVARVKGSNICIVGAVMDCANATARFTAMRQLLDRTLEVINTGTGTTTVTNCNAYSAGRFVPGSSNYNELISRSASTQYRAASTTKVLTSIIAALCSKSLGMKYIVRAAAQTGGSGDNLTTDNYVTVYDLIVDMLLPSSNTAAAVISDMIGDYLYKEYN